MTLTRGDDYPLHQSAEPIAYAGTDRNFYDRYFFNGYSANSDSFFALAFGIYPHINIADAAFSVVRNGVQTSVFASRWLGMERLDLQVGPIRLEITEPLKRLKIFVDAPAQGVQAEISFTARHFPVEEPRFTRRIGPRTLLDYTRLTQNGRYEGWIAVDGVREDVSGFVGTRDRSWGVRPVGARDSQELAPPEPPQFFWLWSPSSFADGSLFAHTNDDAAGHPWNRRAVWAPDGASESELQHFTDLRYEVDWLPGTRNARSATLTLTGDAGASIVRFTPRFNFRMLGIGYGHPKWSHGTHQGKQAIERQDLQLAEVDPCLPHHFHVQALCDITLRDPQGVERRGRGVLEQLVLGAYAPSGFSTLTDMAK